MQNVKMAFLFRPFQPAFKMSSVEIKFAYNCEIIPVKTVETSKDYNSNLSTHPRKTCANVNMEGTPYVLHKARVAHFASGLRVVSLITEKPKPSPRSVNSSGCSSLLCFEGLSSGTPVFHPL